MPLADCLDEARRVMALCTVCDYCSGYCDVFRDAGRLQNLLTADLYRLANLCHNCRNCWHACQYAPPHDFAVNVPKTLARVRRRSYHEHAWPQSFGKLLHGKGLFPLLVIALGMTIIPLLAWLLVPADILYSRHREAGAFYAIVPWRIVVLAAVLPLSWSLMALAISLARFWRNTANMPSTPVLKAVPTALYDILTLRNLGEDLGCNDRDESYSRLRRYFHHAVFYGFLLCFASTTVAALYQYLLGWPAPYSPLSLPVALGSFGGAGIILGSLGLIWIKLTGNPEPVDEEGVAADFAFLGSLVAVAASGLVLLVLRRTPAMGLLLSCHLGAVVGFFMTLPYGKFVHGPYRALAVLHAVRERRKKGTAFSRI